GDVAYLGGYVCFGLAVVRLLRAEPRRRPDAEMILDTALVTFTAGTVTYEFLLAPLLAAGGTVSAILTSIAWASGGVAVLWLILVQMLRRARFPLATAGPIMAGLALSCVANVLYAAGALGGTIRGGGALHLGWDAGLLLLGTAAAAQPAPPQRSGSGARLWRPRRAASRGRVAGAGGPRSTAPRARWRRGRASSSGGARSAPWTSTLPRSCVPSSPPRSRERCNVSTSPSSAATARRATAPWCTPPSVKAAG